MAVAIKGLEVEVKLTDGRLAALKKQLASDEARLQRLASLRAEYANLVASYVSRRFAPRTLKVYREVRIGKTIIGKNRCIDIFCVNEASQKAFAIECKFQDSQGTVDEKIPYALDDLRALPMAGCIAYAGAMLVAAFATWPIAVYLALMVAGAAWMAVMSTFNTATQTSAPPWVKARAVAMHVLCALGSFAIASALWGALSGLFGLTAALCLAAALMASGIFLARRFPLRMGEASDVTPVVTLWEDFAFADEPAPEDGPVAVEIAYRIRTEDATAFLEAASQLRGPRRRDGATFWRLYRDLAEPSRYVERFIVTSWADYLHQRARATLADQELEERVRSFLEAGETATMQHYIAER